MTFDLAATARRLPVLVVDDDPDHVEIVRRVLSRHDSAFEVTHVQDGAACLEALTRQPYAVVLLDYSLPRMNGLEVLEHIRRLDISVPVVMVTGQGNERIAVEAMKSGAIDYVMKTSGYFTTLPTVLGKVLKQHELAQENTRLYQEAQRQEARLRQILNSTSDGIVLLDGEGRVMCSNRQAGELLGFDADGAAGVRLVALLEGNGEAGGGERADRPPRAPFASLEGAAEGDLELRSGARVLRWTTRPTADPSGAPLGSTVTFRDVTQERQVSRLKSDFVSFVAHQLRTPLSGIKWMLELATGESNGGSMLASCIHDAAQSADRLIAMVNDLLNVSTLETGSLTVAAEPIPLGDVTREVLEELSGLIDERRHRVTVDGAEDAPPVVVDRQLFRQVILNLVSNAMQYTPAGGAITIRMFRSDDSACWEIRDTGIGIPAEAQGRLFEKFYRAENALTVDTDGTGLGLYIVRLILKLFDGRVSCHSEEGRGSTFLVTLPLAR